jgi:transcriptional regulator with XRE-family HTH domain
MKVQEKIRFIRESKKMSQEEVANKLNMSTYGYAKIERGETKANIPKLEKIAEVLGIDLMELLTFGEKNLTCFIGDNNKNNNLNGNNISQTDSIELKSEIQILQLTIKHQQDILLTREKEIARLEEIIELMKKQSA